MLKNIVKKSSNVVFADVRWIVFKDGTKIALMFRTLRSSNNLNKHMFYLK